MKSLLEIQQKKGGRWGAERRTTHNQLWNKSRTQQYRKYFSIHFIQSHTPSTSQQLISHITKNGDGSSWKLHLKFKVPRRRRVSLIHPSQLSELNSFIIIKSWRRRPSTNEMRRRFEWLWRLFGSRNSFEIWDIVEIAFWSEVENYAGHVSDVWSVCDGEETTNNKCTSSNTKDTTNK